MKRARFRATALALATVGLFSSPVTAHLPFFVGGVPAFWHPADLPVSYLIQSEGSDDLPFEAVVTAVREAFTTWSTVGDTTFAFAEDTTSDPASTDLGASTHLVLFDEDGSSGWISPHVVALTPVLVQSSGRLIDADIILNGRDFTFTTVAGEPGFDLQSVITHEAGHVLGLDHCVTIAGSMYPFAASQVTHPRSLTEDERVGVRQIYPTGIALGRIVGAVERSGDGTPVRGASVVAVNDEGVVTTTGFTDEAGNFEMLAVPVDIYHLYVQPFSGPVTPDALSLESIETDFATAFYGSNDDPAAFGVVAGLTAELGTIEVEPSTFQLDSAVPTPLIAPRGGVATLFVGGEGITGSDETITVTGTGVVLASPPIFTGSFYSLSLSIAIDAPRGPRSVQVTQNTSAVALLTGILEVVDPAPTIASFTPSVVDAAGGTDLTITGTGFLDNPKVYIGSVRADQVVVVSGTEISCIAPPGLGSVPIQVENFDGQVAVADEDIQLGFVPEIVAVFPAAGSVDGGTPITISGRGFESGLLLELDGDPVAPDAVEFEHIELTTPPGAAGAIAIRVTNPAGFSAVVAGAFTYVDHDDPTVASLSPPEGRANTAVEIEILGSGFHPDVGVRFDVDSDGSGGTAASSVDRLSESRLQVVAPPLEPGIYAVAIENPDGTKACVAAAYTAVPPIATQSGGGGGGGICGAVLPVGRMPTSGEIWGARLPWLLLLVVLTTLVLLETSAERRSRPTLGRSDRRAERIEGTSGDAGDRGPEPPVFL